MVVEYSYNKLKGRIVEKYGSRRAFARELGISEYWLSKKMTGKSPISQQEMESWRRMLDINTEEVWDYFFT